MRFQTTQHSAPLHLWTRFYPVKCWYNNLEKEALGILHWRSYISIFYQGSKCDHISQIIGSNGQQRHCDSTTVTIMHNFAHRPIECAYTIHACTKSMHSRLAISIQSHWRQRPINSWFEHQHTHTQCGNKCPSMHICRGQQKCNVIICRTADAIDIHNKRLAVEQRWLWIFSTRILAYKA